MSGSKKLSELDSFISQQLSDFWASQYPPIQKLLNHGTSVVLAGTYGIGKSRGILPILRKDLECTHQADIPYLRFYPGGEYRYYTPNAIYGNRTEDSPALVIDECSEIADPHQKPSALDFLDSLVNRGVKQVVMVVADHQKFLQPLGMQLMQSLLASQLPAQLYLLPTFYLPNDEVAKFLLHIGATERLATKVSNNIWLRNPRVFNQTITGLLKYGQTLTEKGLDDFIEEVFRRGQCNGVLLENMLIAPSDGIPHIKIPEGTPMLRGTKNFAAPYTLRLNADPSIADGTRAL